MHSEEARAGLYPRGSERQNINEAFQGYFQALGRALYLEQAKVG